MSDQQNKDLAVQIARFGEQLRNLAAGVEDIKTSVKPVAALDRAIAEMSIHNQNARKDIESLWQRIDEGQKERSALEEGIGAVDGRVSEMTSAAKGAMWVLAIVFGALQTMMLAAIVWVFTHINEGDILNRLQQQRIDELERLVNKELRQ